MADIQTVIDALQDGKLDECNHIHITDKARCSMVRTLMKSAELMKSQRELIDHLLEKLASAKEMAESRAELMKEQQEVIEKYHKADSFLEAHGWKWE